ncbi:MAG: hypothetical protein ACLUHE_06660 [Christensenellales bacterium]
MEPILLYHPSGCGFSLLFTPVIEQKANSAQKAGAQCAPLRVQRCNARLFFRNVVGARIARPLSEFVQNLGFAHLLFTFYCNRCKAKTRGRALRAAVNFLHFSG